MEEFGLDKTHSDGRRSICKSCISSYMKNYGQKNADIISHKRKRRYQENREQELKKMRERRKLMGWKWNETRRQRHKENPLLEMYQSAKTRAKRKGLDFKLNPDDLTLPDKCPVLGIPLIVSEETASNNSPTIDRIDNSKGYIPGNIIIISFKANTIKNTASIEDLQKVLTFYQGLQNG